MGRQNNLLQCHVIWQASIAAIVALLSVCLLPFSPFPLVCSARAERNHAAIVSTGTREGRLAVFDDAWSAIHDRYYDREFNGLDWDAQRTPFRALAGETNSGAELYALLRRMIAPLNDPHTRVFSPEEKFDWWRPRFVTIGLVVREVDGFPTVVQLERGSAPERAGVRVGDIITAVNGEPALSAVNRRLINSSSTAGSARSRAFATIIAGPPESSVEIRWRGAGGGERSAPFQRHWQQRDLGLHVRTEKGHYVVFEIDAFTNSIARSFVSILRERSKDIHGVVIDLRGNGGGDAEAMANIASAFLGNGTNLGRFTDRLGIGFTISTACTSLLVADRLAESRLESELPLVVLTSERTSSASEIFIAALKTARRATIIGTETCGCVLAIRTPHVLPDGGVLDISEMDYRTAAGERLEGHRIKPDMTVILERSDLYSGKDRVLETALMKVRSLRNSKQKLHLLVR